MKTTAGFGPAGEQSIYRYTLRRDWTDELGLFGGAALGTAMFLMLNPSTADATKDDPTVAKCVRLARRWGYGALEVRNIFALRSTDPSTLRKVVDPIGPENDTAIVECARAADLIVAAWGNHGAYLGRGKRIREMLAGLGKVIYCFNISNEGQPVHPLYQLEGDVAGMRVWL